MVALVEPGADTGNLEGLDVKQVVGDLRSADSVSTGRQRVPGRLPRRGALPLLGEVTPAPSTPSTSRGREMSSGRPSEAGVERLVYTSTVGTLGLEQRIGVALGRRALLSRRPAPLRLVQALQVRRGARGAARHRPGPAGLAWCCRPSRSGPVTGPRLPPAARPGLPERAHARLRRHRPERRARRRRRGRPDPGPRRGTHGRSYIFGGENLLAAAAARWSSRASPGLPVPRIKVPRSVSLAVAAASEVVEGRLLRRHPSIPLEAARMSTSKMSFDVTRAPVSSSATRRARPCRHSRTRRAGSPGSGKVSGRRLARIRWSAAHGAERPSA